jgi:hypothetical protein
LPIEEMDKVQVKDLVDFVNKIKKRIKKRN